MHQKLTIVSSKRAVRKQAKINKYNSLWYRLFEGFMPKMLANMKAFKGKLRSYRHKRDYA